MRILQIQNSKFPLDLIILRKLGWIESNWIEMNGIESIWSSTLNPIMEVFLGEFKVLWSNFVVS
jgi:hypothetical protein